MKFFSHSDENKFSAGKFFLLMWIIFSVIYIGIDMKKNVIDQAYMKGASLGYEKAITDLINKAQTCDPIPVFLEQGGKKHEATLINQRCTQAKTATESVETEN